MIEDRQLGYNRKAKEILKLIEENPRIENNDIVKRSDYSAKTCEKLIKYLAGKGEIKVTNKKPLMFKATPNRETTVTTENIKPIIDNVRELVHEIREETNEEMGKYRLIIQKVE